MNNEIKLVGNAQFKPIELCGQTVGFKLSFEKGLCTCCKCPIYLPVITLIIPLTFQLSQSRIRYGMHYNRLCQYSSRLILSCFLECIRHYKTRNGHLFTYLTNA